ncbi:MAG: hypothetical protein H0T69_02280 [Thermoleophilaceae bacterium]|nr:hypothetical protein [Thermoleophilaceae bacterium]
MRVAGPAGVHQRRPGEALESEMTAVLYSGVESVGHLDAGGSVRGATPP